MMLGVFEQARSSIAAGEEGGYVLDNACMETAVRERWAHEVIGVVENTGWLSASDTADGTIKAKFGLSRLEESRYGLDFNGDGNILDAAGNAGDANVFFSSAGPGGDPGALEHVFAQVSDMYGMKEAAILSGDRWNPTEFAHTLEYGGVSEYLRMEAYPNHGCVAIGYRKLTQVPVRLDNTCWARGLAGGWSGLEWPWDNETNPRAEIDGSLLTIYLQTNSGDDPAYRVMEEFAYRPPVDAITASRATGTDPDAEYTRLAIDLNGTPDEISAFVASIWGIEQPANTSEAELNRVLSALEDSDNGFALYFPGLGCLALGDGSKPW